MSLPERVQRHNSLILTQPEPTGKQLIANLLAWTRRLLRRTETLPAKSALLVQCSKQQPIVSDLRVHVSWTQAGSVGVCVCVFVSIFRVCDCAFSHECTLLQIITAHYVNSLSPREWLLSAWSDAATAMTIIQLAPKATAQRPRWAWRGLFLLLQCLRVCSRAMGWVQS